MELKLMTRAEYMREYRKQLRERAFTAIGFTCVFCGTRDKVQAAHIRPTKIKGMGRGLERRYLDVLRNPSSYRPMCCKHHRVFDNIMRCVKVEVVVDEPIPF